MIRVVLDSNIYISALLFNGKPARVLRLAKSGIFQLMTSQPLRLEVLHVLQEKFKWTEERLETVFDLGWGPAVRVPTEIEIRACSDPDDDRVLECAVSGMVSVIVTGDHHTLVMQSFQGIGILTPNDFLLEIMKSDG